MNRMGSGSEWAGLITDEVMRWADGVVPKLGNEGSYAQIDLDTLIRLPKRAWVEVPEACVQAFLALREHAQEQAWVVGAMLRLPLEDYSAGVYVAPDVDAVVLSRMIDLSGDLRGRSVPGFVISDNSMPAQRYPGPLEQRRVRLRWDAPVGSSAFFEERAEEPAGTDYSIWNRGLEFWWDTLEKGHREVFFR